MYYYRIRDKNDFVQFRKSYRNRIPTLNNLGSFGVKVTTTDLPDAKRWLMERGFSAGKSTTRTYFNVFREPHADINRLLANVNTFEIVPNGEYKRMLLSVLIDKLKVLETFVQTKGIRLDPFRRDQMKFYLEPLFKNTPSLPTLLLALDNNKKSMDVVRNFALNRVNSWWTNLLFGTKMHFATNLKQNKKPAHRFDVTDMVTFVTVAPEFIDDPRIKSHFQSMANRDKRSYILSNGTTINPKGLSNNKRKAIKNRSFKRKMDVQMMKNNPKRMKKTISKSINSYKARKNDTQRILLRWVKDPSNRDPTAESSVRAIQNKTLELSNPVLVKGKYNNENEIKLEYEKAAVTLRQWIIRATATNTHRRLIRYDRLGNNSPFIQQLRDKLCFVTTGPLSFARNNSGFPDTNITINTNHYVFLSKNLSVEDEHIVPPGRFTLIEIEFLPKYQQWNYICHFDADQTYMTPWARYNPQKMLKNHPKCGTFSSA